MFKSVYPGVVVPNLDMPCSNIPTYLMLKSKASCPPTSSTSHIPRDPAGHESDAIVTTRGKAHGPHGATQAVADNFQISH